MEKESGTCCSKEESAIGIKDEIISNDGYFYHETSKIDANVKIGFGTKIWHFSHILSKTKIGKHCSIGQNCMIGPDVTVGNQCKIQNNVSLYKGVILENKVFCGPSCVFTNVTNPRAFVERKDEFKSTIVKEGATIGANSTILCGVTIGEYAMIGAGAVITKDVEPYTVVIKNNIVIGKTCKCASVISHNGFPPDCRCMK